MPFILLILCFAAWGAAANLTDVLVGVFRTIFDMSNFQSALVQFAYYGAYFTLAIPAALINRRFGYKVGVLTGLGLAAIGGLLFIPASSALVYGFFLLALFVLAAGLSILETSANPFVIAMGPEDSATQRLNLAQAFNPVGANIGVMMGAVLILPQITSEASKTIMSRGAAPESGGGPINVVYTINEQVAFGASDAGIFAQVGALYAYERPDAPSMLQTLPLLPAELKPPVPVTNEAALGYAFDETTSPEALALIRIRAGGLAAGGDPRPWQEGELTPIRRFARAYAADAPNATEWYYPRRLLLDFDAASDLRMNEAARILGLRLEHGREIDLPLYAFSTDLTKGRVARGARKLARLTPIEKPVVIDDRRTSHLDPLSAAPKRNSFLKSVVPFLKRISRGPAS